MTDAERRVFLVLAGMGAIAIGIVLFLSVMLKSLLYSAPIWGTMLFMWWLWSQ